jgi:hypothetical protein
VRGSPAAAVLLDVVRCIENLEELLTRYAVLGDLVLVDVVHGKVVDNRS